MTRIGEFPKNRLNENSGVGKTVTESTQHRGAPINIQDQLLNQLRRDRTAVSVELMSGTVIKGVITGFDSYSVVLENDGRQLVYKHGIVLIRWSTT